MGMIDAGLRLPELRVPARWLEQQQFSFAATVHSLQAEADPKAQQRLLSYLWREPTPPQGAELDTYRKRLESLSPSVLELICSLSDRQIDDWADHQAIWQTTRSRLTWDPLLGRSPWAAAKLIGDRLLAGLFDPSQIRRIFRTELKTDRDLLDGFETGLMTLTRALGGAKSAYDRLDALTAFSEQGPPSLWSLVENVVLPQSLSWPLLVIGEDISCALPAVVSVLTGEDAARWAIDERVTVIDGPHADGQQWKPSLETARTAAIELWETKHASEDRELQEGVRNAKVILDLRLASKIVAPTLPKSGVDLSGRSLEAYVALEILSQLLGHGSLGSTCATGEIGESHPNGTPPYVESRGAFPAVGAVGGVNEKVECVRRAFYFNKFIVPIDEDGPAPTSHDHLRVIGIVGTIDKQSFGRSDRGFSGYASEALGQRWRRHRYVRCPDIALTFQPFRRLWPSREAAFLRRLFGRTAQPVVRPSGYSPLEIAHALYWINRAADEDPNPKYDAYAGCERLGRFAFIRAVPHETHERFWSVFWDACRGTQDGFRRFVLAPSLGAAAAELAALLNNVKPRAGERVAAPDAIVIFGAQFLNDEGPKPLRSDPFARFRLDFLVDELLGSRLLEPCGNEVLQAHLGVTRLILVAEDPPPSDSLRRLWDADLEHPLSQLAVFRNGFTESMARGLLELDDEAYRRVAAALKCRRPGIPAAMVFAEKAQEYVLRTRAPLPGRPAELARLHLRAANAIAGILDRTHRPAHHDFDTALRPDYLHEAQWHAEQAFRLAPVEPRGQRGSVRDRAVDARERLSRIGEPFTWSRLRWATRHSTQAGEDMWLAAKAAIAEMAPASPHPVQLLWLAKFARKLEKQQAASAARWSAERVRLLEEALTACASLGGREALAAEFAVRTTRATMAMEEQPDDAGYDAAADDNRQAWSLYQAFERESGPGVMEILDNRWFELCGDGVEDPDEAMRRYDCGFRNERLRGAHFVNLGALVKSLGCRAARGNGLNRDQWRTLDSWLTPDHWRRIEVDRRPTAGLVGAPRAGRRWKAGRAMLLYKARF